MQWVRDTDPLVRSFAARGLRAATADSAGQRTTAGAALLAALVDVDAHVRINVVAVLGAYRDSTYSQRVAALLGDSDLNVRIATAHALGLLKGSAAARALEARVSDTAEPPAVRGAALAALVLASSERGLARANEFAGAADPLLRLYAARALGTDIRPTGMTLLRSLADDPDRRVQVQAVSSVAGIAGDTMQSARAFFIEKLAGGSPYIRAEALSGLQRLAVPGDEAIVMEAFEFALRDSVEEAAVAALRVLAKLADKNPAIQRSFVTRFPVNRIPLMAVRQAAVRQLKLDEPCCTLAPRPALYSRVVATLVAPALRGMPLPRVRINTAPGSFELELVAADAPLTVDNFMTLVRKKYFDGSRWHRVVPNFVLQDGDPTGTGSGGPGYAIRDEMNRVRYLQGTLGMALSGPDTGGSQFFVTHSPQPHLDGGYTVFGHVVSGMEIAERVVQDDAILSIEVIE
jgi:cyclophilin family peptidyl-prolyl cis-trans isomerase/HEAT repeat protein